MTRVVVFFSLLATLSCVGGEPFQRHERLTLDELKQFAEKSSGFGGELRFFEHEGKKIAVVTRSFTSGVQSSDLGVYAAGSDGRYHRVLYREPVWGSFLTPIQKGNLVTVIQEPRHPPQGARDAFAFSITRCFDPQDK
jgi:hypothetical protein